MPLILTRRYLRHRPLVHLPNPTQRFLALLLSHLLGIPIRILLQSSIIEPNVVVSRFVSQFLLVLNTTFAEDGGFDARAVAELFFEIGVGGVELGGTGTGESVESELWWWLIIVEKRERGTGGEGQSCAEETEGRAKRGKESKDHERPQLTL